LTKEEVLKIEDKYDRYYCKDDFCVLENSRVEIPDKTGKKISYITTTCSVEDITAGKCYSDK